MMVIPCLYITSPQYELSDRCLYYLQLQGDYSLVVNVRHVFKF